MLLPIGFCFFGIIFKDHTYIICMADCLVKIHVGGVSHGVTHQVLTKIRCRTLSVFAPYKIGDTCGGLRLRTTRSRSLCLGLGWCVTRSHFSGCVSDRVTRRILATIRCRTLINAPYKIYNRRRWLRPPQASHYKIAIALSVNAPDNITRSR